MNPNTVDMPGSTNTLSPFTSLVLFGKLATPAAPELEWFNPTEGDAAHAKLRFQAISAPSGSSPSYEFQLYNFTTGEAVGSWQGIDLGSATGDGSPNSPYTVRLVPSPGRYTVAVRAQSSLNAGATSDASAASPARSRPFPYSSESFDAFFCFISDGLPASSSRSFSASFSSALRRSARRWSTASSV